MGTLFSCVFDERFHFFRRAFRHMFYVPFLYVLCVCVCVLVTRFDFLSFLYILFCEKLDENRYSIMIMCVSLMMTLLSSKI